MTNNDRPSCPKCGAMMVLRTRKSDQVQFWGCTKYPVCRGTMDLKAVPVVQPQQSKKTFVPSPYQDACREWVINSQPGDCAMVEAVAGSGKTTTAVWLLNFIPREAKVAFIAFNKHIALELRSRVPSNTLACTYHSLGFAAIRNTFGNVKVDTEMSVSKVDSILNNLIDRRSQRHLYAPIKKLVGLVKGNLLSTSSEDLLYLADRFGIELNGDQELIFQMVDEVIKRSAKMTSIIDFDDMCWLPVYLNLPCEQYDWLIVDEFQDTNKCQMALALMSVHDEGRIMGIGDRYQSIYGFRGADTDGIPNMIKTLNATVLPLSVSYRCPRSHVSFVNTMFPHIRFEANPNGKEGILRDADLDKFTSELTAGDLILCRTNAPLVDPAFSLIRRGIKAIIRGRDIGKGLQDLIHKMKCSDISSLLSTLKEYYEKENAKLLEMEKTNQAQALSDKVETIIALASGVNSLDELDERIDSIFSDDNVGVVFSSVHKAKGLEAERVYIIRPDLMPHPMAKKEWEADQEVNLQYVAYTRSLNELVVVHGK